MPGAHPSTLTGSPDRPEECDSYPEYLTLPRRSHPSSLSPIRTNRTLAQPDRKRDSWQRRTPRRRHRASSASSVPFPRRNYCPSVDRPPACVIRRKTNLGLFAFFPRRRSSSRKTAASSGASLVPGFDRLQSNLDHCSPTRFGANGLLSREIGPANSGLSCLAWRRRTPCATKRL